MTTQYCRNKTRHSGASELADDFVQVAIPLPLLVEKGMAALECDTVHFAEYSRRV